MNTLQNKNKNMNRSFVHVLALAAISVSFASCSNTRIVSSWHEPGVSVDKRRLDKVLMVALIKDDATRRITEDQLVAFSAPHGIASYHYLGNDIEAINDPRMNDRLVNDRINGIMIMRLADREKEQVWVPGMMMPGMMMSPWGFGGFAGPMMNQGFMTVDVTYVIQTNVYSTEPSRLLWTGTTTTVNPNRLANSMHDVTRVVYKQMVKDGFIRKEQKFRNKGRRG